MNITIIGAGYVGLVTAACFSELGHDVICVDIDIDKIANLRLGIVPIYEPGLKELINKNIDNQKLSFSTSLEQSGDVTQIYFITVGTPNNDHGEINTQYITNTAKSLGRNIKNNCLIVDKSTVPIGMTHQIKKIIDIEIRKRKANIQIEIASNPEFLREGEAIQDFMVPDRIIIGCHSSHAKNRMFSLYSSFVDPKKIYFMNIKEAEMTKYAANAMLASKISLMNEIALLCETLNVDVENVRLGVGADSRIGHEFMAPGCGYGGSCFPKDIRALIKINESVGINPLILRAIEERNNLQKQILFKKILKHFNNNLSGIKIAIWGLSFKPNTDDMREAPSIFLIENLIKYGATVQVFDPVAMPVAKRIFSKDWINSKKLSFSREQYSVLKNADALTLVTEWPIFKKPDLIKIKKLMRGFNIFDGRNQYDPKIMYEAGFYYYGVGRKQYILNNALLKIDLMESHYEK